MSEQLFPSGPWVGFYNYSGPEDRHRMNLHLAFAGGRMTGDGNDDVGRFLIQGRYDTAALECHWTKTYPGSHDVFYRGFREGKGIWGTWEIHADCHGGFHIWPRSAGEGEEHQETNTEQKPVEAVADQALTAKGYVSQKPTAWPSSRRFVICRIADLQSAVR
ncbi:MAG: hypothetical protein HYY23_04040 [Verrucomicrobia bacterium]|nr:hypothetical protein [Verrucomicrobiota bacterium]